MKESHIVEFKEAWRDEYLKWICGFANAEGGVLILGRDDKGKVVGVKDAERLLRDLPNKIRDVLGIMADVRLKEGGGKELVEVRVDPYSSEYLKIIVPTVVRHAESGAGLGRTTPIATPIATPITVEAIVEYLRRHPTASRSDIAKALGFITPEGVRYHLRKLKACGRIEHSGPPHGGRWEVH